MRLRIATVFVLLTLLGASAPALQPGDGHAREGVSCQSMEGSVLHVHAHLAIFDRAQAVPIPSDVGRPAAAGCRYWIHTHTSDGIIHIESPVQRSFTLGQFFAIWGRRLTPQSVAGHVVGQGERLRALVGGEPFAADPSTIPLRQHADIIIEVGPPYPSPTPFASWNGL
ncbi:MAG: hypothetical protein KGM44_01990 [bacterium]|nr:hypothetical protein [bacterium]